MVSKNPGPYDALRVVDAINSFLLENNEGFGECLELIRQKSIEASQVGCLLQYATEETERPVVLTRHEFFKLFPGRIVH